MPIPADGTRPVGRDHRGGGPSDRARFGTGTVVRSESRPHVPGAADLVARHAMPSRETSMNVAVCVKQIPDPAVPGELDRDHTLKREGKLILDESDSYGVEMALQLVDKAGGGEVTLVSMAPEQRGVGPAHRAGHGRGQGDARLRRRARRAPTRCAPPRCSPRRRARRRGRPRARPPPSRPTATPARSRPGRRAARLAVAHVRQARRDRRRQGQDPAPDRGRLRRRRGVAPRGRERDRRCGRAALPVVQGDHGGEEQAGRPGHRRRPRPRRRPGRMDGRPPADHRRSPRHPARQAGEKIEDDGDAFEQVVEFLEGLKVI